MHILLTWIFQAIMSEQILDFKCSLLQQAKRGVHQELATKVILKYLLIIFLPSHRILKILTEKRYQTAIWQDLLPELSTVSFGVFSSRISVRC